MEIVMPRGGPFAFCDPVARDAVAVLAAIDAKAAAGGLRGLSDDELYAIQGCVEVIGQAVRLWEMGRLVSVAQELRRRGLVG